MEYPEPISIDSGDLVQTKITNSLGQQSLYPWRLFSDHKIPQLLSSKGAGCATCSSTGFDYSYDSYGRLIESVKNGQGNATGKESVSYRYDDHGRIDSIISTSGAGVQRLIERREYNDNFSLQYSKVFRPSVNPNAERVVEIERNASGLPIKIVNRGWAPWVALPNESDYVLGSTKPTRYNPVVRIIKYEYEDGKLISIDGPLENVDDTTTLQWSDQNLLVAVNQPLKPAIHYSQFDSLGRATVIQIGNENPLNITYNQAGKISRLKRTNSDLTYQYDEEGRFIRYSDSDGRTEVIQRDSAGRSVEAVDELGRRTQRILNSESQVSRQVSFDLDDTLIRSLSFVFDAYSRVESVGEERLGQNGMLGFWQSEYHRSTDGEINAQVDQATGIGSEFQFNDTDRISTLMNSFGEKTQYHFDALGQEMGLVDARGNHTQRYRDDYNAVTGLISPDTGIERYERDESGAVIRRVQEDSGTTTYSRDAAGRMIARVPEEGPATRWTYDVTSGRVSVAEHGGIVDRYNYNDNSLLASHVRELDDKRFETKYERDQRGRINSKTLPDGKILKYRYHSDGPTSGMVASIHWVRAFGLMENVIVDDIDQDARDGEMSWNSHNGITNKLMYSAGGFVSNVNVSGLLSIELERDFNGHILSRKNAGRIDRFDYGHGRLIGANTIGGQYRFSYDAVGNRTERLEQHSNGKRVMERFEYASTSDGSGNGNRLVKKFDETTGEQYFITHTAGGMLEQKNALSFTYDAERRPISVSENGREIVRYSYNAFGERVKKEFIDKDGKKRAEYFLFDGARLQAIANNIGEITEQFVYLGDTRAVAKLQGKDVFAIHGDHLGTPLRMTDERGDVVWSAYYEPFGQARILLDTVSLDLRLPGQFYDSETGSHYNYFRDYDPDLGRYVTSDPIGLNGGINTYLYAQADPLAFADPWGLRVILVDRDLNGVPIGRHHFLVIIPDNPSDFPANTDYDIGFGGPFRMTDVGNGEMGFVIGAQNINGSQNTNGRLIAEAFNSADTTATTQLFDPSSAPWGWGNYSPNETACALPVDPATNQVNDTAVINQLLSNITNFNNNEATLNIPYPGNGPTIGSAFSNSGYVNSNSWALSALDSVNITPAQANMPGADLMNANRLDPAYFTASPNLATLTAENTDTDNDGVLDSLDNDDDNDGVPDSQDTNPRDPSQP